MGNTRFRIALAEQGSLSHSKAGLPDTRSSIGINFSPVQFKKRQLKKSCLKRVGQRSEISNLVKDLNEIDEV